MIVGILDRADSEQNRGFGDCLTSHGRHVYGHMLKAVGMARFGAFLLAKADRYHFDQAAFIGATKSCVRLDSVDQDNTVGVIGIFIHINRQSV